MLSDQELKYWCDHLRRNIVSRSIRIPYIVWREKAPQVISIRHMNQFLDVDWGKYDV